MVRHPDAVTSLEVARLERELQEVRKLHQATLQGLALGSTVIAGQVAEFRTETAARFDKVDQRLGGIDQRFDTVDLQALDEFRGERR